MSEHTCVNCGKGTYECRCPEFRSTKEIFKPVACATPLNHCTFCGWPAELYSRSNADGTFSEKAVMCSNFGDDDPTGNACPLHLPPEDFYHATKREAIQYWNERTARGKERITASLTAEVAELRREQDMWSQLWDNVKLDNPNLRDDNKPLAIAACYALMKLEMDRMREALVMSVNAMREPFDGWKGEVEALALAAARAALGEKP